MTKIIEEYTASASRDVEQQVQQKNEFEDATLEVLNPLWLAYAERVKGMTPATIQDYGYVLAGFAADPAFRQAPAGVVLSDKLTMKQRRAKAENWPAKPAHTITVADAEAWRDAMLAAGLAPRTVNKQRQALSNVLGWAARSKRFPSIEENVILELEKVKEPPAAEIDFYEPEELERIAAMMRTGKHRTDRMPRGGKFSREEARAMRAAEDEQDAVLVLVLAKVGARLGEARCLRWKDFDFGRDRVKISRTMSGGVEQEYTKGKKSRRLPLLPALADELKRLRKRTLSTGRDDLVFVGETGEHIDESAFRRRFKKAAEKAGLRKLRVHDLRHGFLSLAAEQFPAHRVQDFGGHADPRTTARYTHGKERPDDIDRLAEAFTSRNRETAG